MRSLILIFVGLLLGTLVSSSFAKVESGSIDAKSVVGYGKNGTQLVAILVDSSGVLQTQ